jgi:L-lactate dehydrogenase
MPLRGQFIISNSLAMSKIAVIGAGAVGSTIAYTATIQNLASKIILIDRDEAKEEGQVMDIADGLCFVETSCVKGANFRDARDADVIVITAGAPQNKDETRLDLVEKNKEILKSIFRGIGRLKKSAVIMIISNPVDILTRLAQKISGLPVGQVFGSGTTLDTARLKTKLAHHFKINPHNVHGLVIGEHGDSEFVAWSGVTIGGVPIKKIKGFNEKLSKQIETRVRREAYEIINRKGATYFGIALVATDIIHAVLYDQQKIIPVSHRLNKWNGISGVCLGAPAIVGRSGVEKSWPLKLTTAEKAKMQKSAKKIKQYL